jgi:site-specific DNA recombinase
MSVACCETSRATSAIPKPASVLLVLAVPELRIVDRSTWDAVQARLLAIRASPGSQKQRKTEFWKHRRPKHVFHCVYCGECGGSMAAIGKDYLACTAARSGAGCSNRKSVKRNRVEQVVLEGLKQLMAPELVEEFIRAFHEELNRENLANELQKAQHHTELLRTTRKLKGLYDAIADGLRSPGLTSSYWNWRPGRLSWSG